MQTISATSRKTGILYGGLAVLAAILLACQSLYSVNIVRLYQRLTYLARSPIDYTDAQVIFHAEPEATAAGVRVGDRLERINGKLLDGRRLLQETLARDRAGGSIALQVLRPQGQRFLARVILAPLGDQPASSHQWALVVVGFLFIPLFSLCLGFSVALLRPFDERAWNLLALLASFSQMFHVPGTEGFIPEWVLLLRFLLASSFGLWLVLFAGNFPERSRWILHRPAMRWCALSPLFGLTAILFVKRVLELHHLSLVANWAMLLSLLQKLQMLTTLLAVVWFFAELGGKTRRGATDAYRRLKILWISTFISFAPIFSLVVRGMVLGRDAFAAPAWIVIPSMLALDVFPCALAYIIVVRKAAEPNAILRQGMQYALARKSLPILRTGFIVALFAALIRVISQPGISRAEQVKATLVVAAVTLLLDHGLTSRLTRWVDTHFFREGYDIERLLSTFANAGFRESSAVLDLLEGAISNALHVSRTSIFLEDHGSYRNRLTSRNETTEPVTLSAESPLVRCLLRTEQPWLIDWDDPKSCLTSLAEAEQDVLRSLGAELVVPLPGKTHALGFWLLGEKRSEEPYSSSEMHLLHSVAVQASLALENSLLLQSLEQEIIERERKNAEQDALEKASHAKSEFIARMSHELRTPLNAIIGYSEMLQEDALESENKNFVVDLEKISSAAKHLLSVINSILDISKIEAGKMELYIEPFSVEKVVTDAVSIVHPLIRRNSNQFHCVFGPGLGSMVSDALKIRQILFNLLSNAAKFTERGTIHLKVDAAVESGIDMIYYEVSDTGIGMTPQQVSKLLVPFVQADHSIGSKYGGTGLGLAICRHFSQMMGGDIEVQSRFGEGTRVMIRLPRIAASAQPASAVLEQPLPVATENYSGTVLVIDDDPATCERIRRGLQSLGARVIGTSSGREGLRKARELLPDLITLDVLMDGMDGWDVLAQLKDDPALAEIPVVMLTVLDEKNKALTWGVAEYLIKPFDRKELSSVLGKYLGEALPPVSKSASILVVDDDEATRRLIKLTLQERGWQVDEAENGRVGMRRVQEHAPRMIFLDLMMPEVDGFVFLSELRKSRQFAEIPVVVLTSKNITPAERQALSAKATQVFNKLECDLDQIVAGVGVQLASQLRLKDKRHG